MEAHLTTRVFKRRQSLLFKSLKQLLVILFFSSSVQAAVSPYSFSTLTGVSLETGSFTNLLGTSMDDDASALTNIGFTFTYNGTNYTQFSATSNGLLQFGASASTEYSNAFTSLTGPYLLPYWDDNYTDVDGNVQYLLMGAPGSRKLVVEFNLSYLGNSGTADKHFQIWLFETSNIAQFVYGAGNNLNGNFSVGILTHGSTDFKSVSTSGNTVSTTVQNDSNASWPGSGTSYRFNPGVDLAVEFSSFEYACDEQGINLMWKTESEVNCKAFEIESSRDGSNFLTIGSQNGSGTTQSQSTYSMVISNSYEIEYIRLNQIDLDGKQTIYGPFVISCDQEKIQLYPNPANERVTISYPENSGETTIIIWDNKGNVLSESQHNFSNSGTKTIDLSDFASGMYLAKVATKNGVSMHHLLIE